MIINTNINSIKTGGSLKKVNEKNTKALEKLSSGLKINRAADDSAGLAISEKMRSQIRGLTQASKNLQDGISFVQTADGALGSVHDMLQRGRELCIQAANDTNTPEDRQKITAELAQLNKQIDSVGADTEFNTLKIFTGGVTADDEEMFRMIAEIWVGSAIDAIHNTFSSLSNAGSGNTMDIVFANMGTGTMASMTASGITSGPNAGATAFTLRININYFDAALKTAYGNSGGGSAATGYELYDKIIAHEMMHAAMYDTMWTNMAGTGATIPSWFKEGSAEAVGGGFYRIDNMANTAVQNGLGNGGLYDYSSGYAATMYLGYLAGGGGVTNTDIAAGLDKIYADLAKGDSFDQALQKNVSMTTAQFISDFQSAAGNTFLDNLRIAVGSGSGSVAAASLGTSAEATIADAPDPYVPGVSAFTVSNTLEAIESTLIIHSGANSDQNMKVNRFGLSADVLGLPSASALGTQQSFNDSIKSYDDAVSTVSNMRSYYGAVQNSMDYAMSNVDSYAEKMTASESRIRDADVSLLMVEFTKTNILSQAATAMLAQANQMPQNIMTLLR